MFSNCGCGMCVYMCIVVRLSLVAAWYYPRRRRTVGALRVNQCFPFLSACNCTGMPV